VEYTDDRKMREENIGKFGKENNKGKSGKRVLSVLSGRVLPRNINFKKPIPVLHDCSAMPKTAVLCPDSPCPT
jgi:hypothetical protein